MPAVFTTPQGRRISTVETTAVAAQTVAATAQTAATAAESTATAAYAATAPAFLDAVVTVGHNLNQNGGVQVPTSVPLAHIGTPSRVHVIVNIHARVPDNLVGQRVAPVVELYRTSGGTDVLLGSIASYYVRDATDHEESSGNAVFPDPAPGVDPTYELRTRRDSNSGQQFLVEPASTVTLEIRP